MKRIAIALLLLGASVSWAGEVREKSHDEAFRELRKKENKAVRDFEKNPARENLDELVNVFEGYKDHYQTLEKAYQANTSQEGVSKYRSYRDKAEYYDGMLRGIHYAEIILNKQEEQEPAEASMLHQLHERLKADFEKAQQKIKELEAALSKKTGIPMAPAIPEGAKPWSE